VAARAEVKPFGAFEWMLAMRYLWTRRKKSVGSVIALFSLIGIAIAVTAMIVAMAVLNGFRKDFFNKVLGVQGHIMVVALDRDFTDFDDVAQKIKALPDIESVFPIIEGQTLAKSPFAESGGLVRGIRENDLKALNIISSRLCQPGLGTLKCELPMPPSLAHALDGFNNSKNVVIGSDLALAIGASVGDEITLLGSRGPSTAFGTFARNRSYKVQAIFKTGMNPYDRFIFLPLEEAQSFYNLSGKVHYLETFIKDIDKIDEVKAGIVKVIAPNRGLSDWRATNGELYNAMTLERKVAFVVVTLIMFVAVLNIVSGLIVLVKDKGGDIAILRTMGATRASIMRVFFITGSSIGVVGTTLGFICGVLFSWNINAIHDGLSSLLGGPLFNPRVYGMEKLPMNMTPIDITVVVSITLLFSLSATIYPSWRAARLDPVEALRHE
jgi:lipoprotein-releasing system permease protein